jgi:ribose/xylose/arabinose/galactoside ABC-type transport system permease subunit
MTTTVDPGSVEGAASTRQGRPPWWLQLLLKPEAGIAIVLVILAILITIANPAFATPSNLLNLLRSIAIIGIVAVGMTYVIIVGELDLSIASILALSAVTGATMTDYFIWPVAAALGLLTGVVAGLVNGLLVTKTGVNSFIVTLGTLSVFRGIALFMSQGIPVRGLEELTPLGQGTIGPVPVQVVILVIVVVVGQLVLSRTVLGTQVHAVGDNAKAARLSGLPVARIKIIAFVMVGFLAALAGLLRAAQLGVAEPNAAIGLELQVIAATVIGGASLSGGKGSVIGSFLGACLLGVMSNAFVLLQLSSFLQVIATGGIIVLAAVFDRLRVRLGAR